MKRGKDQIIGGVCSGFAEYFNIDISLMRIFWLILSVCTTMPMLLIYIICWIVMENEDRELNI